MKLRAKFAIFDVIFLLIISSLLIYQVFYNNSINLNKTLKVYENALIEDRKAKLQDVIIWFAPF
ncbi:MAG: hypothetical protein ACK4YF_08030 [Exilispira sp.]